MHKYVIIFYLFCYKSTTNFAQAIIGNYIKLTIITYEV